MSLMNSKVARKTRPLLVALAALTQGACERVVSIDVDEGPERLVVEARLEAIQGAPSGRQSFRLTTTAAYFSNVPTPPARGATVTVTDDRGRAVSFVESTRAPGQYETQDLVAEVGRTYTLRIDWKGDRYESTERLDAVPPIDSLYFMSREGKDAATDGLRATINMRDPMTQTNYYMWDQWIDGTMVRYTQIPYTIRIVASDEMYSGGLARNFQPFDETKVQSGQTVKMRQYSISESVWRYYVALNQQGNGDGSPFAVPAANVRGNVANLTRPEVRALGYFIASAVAEKEARVP
ncbi:MAG: DUF4249 domain-containing protein [Gemmatimonadaceae bacterium]|nr:DUF4249 domain-containing protein [Gemmatimonadaceae bacterium]